MCPGREALLQASGSMEVARGQATKGSSAGRGGRTNFLIGYRGADSKQVGGSCSMPPMPVSPHPHAHTAARGQKSVQAGTQTGPRGWGQPGEGFAKKKTNDTQENKQHKTKERAVSKSSRAAATRGRPSPGQSEACVHGNPAPRPGALCLMGLCGWDTSPAAGGQSGVVTHPGTAEWTRGKPGGGTADRPRPGGVEQNGDSSGGAPSLSPGRPPKGLET
jgi:hypothetical protein